MKYLICPIHVGMSHMYLPAFACVVQMTKDTVDKIHLLLKANKAIKPEAGAHISIPISNAYIAAGRSIVDILDGKYFEFTGNPPDDLYYDVSGMFRMEINSLNGISFFGTFNGMTWNTESIHYSNILEALDGEDDNTENSTTYCNTAQPGCVRVHQDNSMFIREWGTSRG